MEGKEVQKRKSNLLSVTRSRYCFEKEIAAFRKKIAERRYTLAHNTRKQN